MPIIDVVVETPISRSSRARQVEAMFDVPISEKSRLEWKGEIPIEESEWNVGLIVGPSGSGKSTIAKKLFEESYHPELEWVGGSVIDDISKEISIEDLSGAFSAVGFNTIPAWLRPFSVLSNGERFRVELARRLLELPDPIVVDEFTSVVDRQVAKIGSHAVQKHVRKHGRQFVAVTCHYDVIDWLQPDWVFEPSTMTLTRRRLRRRPQIETSIARVDYSAWRIFAPFHYLTADLNRSAACYCTFVDDVPAAFTAVLHYPHPKVKNLKRLSRAVCLPDWQGLGLYPHLSDTVAAAYAAQGFRMRSYPAHPAFVRIRDRSPSWSMVKAPGAFSSRQGRTSTIGEWKTATRPCAVFEYVGERMPNVDEAARLTRG